MQQHAVELERLKNEINTEQQKNYKAQIEELQKSLNSSNATIKSLNQKIEVTETKNFKLDADLQQVQSQLENMTVRNDKNMQESMQGIFLWSVSLELQEKIQGERNYSAQLEKMVSLYEKFTGVTINDVSTLQRTPLDSEEKAEFNSFTCKHKGIKKSIDD